jgi:hypothetical protein
MISSVSTDDDIDDFIFTPREAEEEEIEEDEQDNHHDDEDGGGDADQNENDSDDDVGDGEVEDDEDDDTGDDEDDDDDDSDDDDSDDDTSDSSSSSLEARDIKVVIQGIGVTRGFSKLNTNSGFAKINSTLEKDYNLPFSLFYLDDDGDNVQILRKADFVYALRNHCRQHSSKMKVMRLVATLNRHPVTPVKVTADIAEAKSHSDYSPTNSAKVERNLSGSAEILSSSIDWQRGEMIGSGSFGTGITMRTYMDSHVHIRIREHICIHAV